MTDLYYGSPCKNCGNTERYSSGACVQCAKRRAREWGQTNSRRALENQRRWRQNNPERYKKYYARHAQTDKFRATQRRYEQSEKGKFANSQKRKRNRISINIKGQRRRAREKGGGGNYTVAEWEALCKQYDYCCLACGRDDVKLTADHVVPVDLGGSNNISNIQPLCGPCNSRKGNRYIDYRTKPNAKRWIQGKLF